MTTITETSAPEAQVAEVMPWFITIYVHIHKFNEYTGGTFCGFCGTELKVADGVNISGTPR